MLARPFFQQFTTRHEVGKLQELFAEQLKLEVTTCRWLQPSLAALTISAMNAPAPIRIEHLFISPGHNYFGHHEKPPGEHARLEVPEVECVAGSGLRGDRFFDFKENYKGQITFFAMEVFEALQCELNLPEARPGATRRNVFTRGVDLNTLIGQTFEIQGVQFEGVCECSPCYWMNSALGPGAEKWLQTRGGLRARILTNGTLRVAA